MTDPRHALGPRMTALCGIHQPKALTTIPKEVTCQDCRDTMERLNG